MKTDPFREYLIQAEPGRREKGYVWNTAIGLQAVDGLKPSQYLVDTAVQNIETELKKRIKFQPELQHYYQKMHLVLHLQNIWQFIRNYLQEFIRMPEKSGIITLQKKNGY